MVSDERFEVFKWFLILWLANILTLLHLYFPAKKVSFCRVKKYCLWTNAGKLAPPIQEEPSAVIGRSLKTKAFVIGQLFRITKSD